MPTVTAKPDCGNKVSYTVGDLFPGLNYIESNNTVAVDPANPMFIGKQIIYVDAHLADSDLETKRIYLEIDIKFVDGFIFDSAKYG